MKKKILMLVAVFMLVCGVVSASSKNGQYKGDEIVKVFHDGKELQVEDVPAILHEDRTLIPVYLFKQMGVELTWDLEKFSVDVKLPEPAKTGASFDISKIAAEAKKFEIGFVEYVSDGKGFNRVTYYYDKGLEQMSSGDFDSVLTNSTTTDATLTVLSDINGNTFDVPTGAVRDFKQGKISYDELGNMYRYNQKPSTPPSPQPSNSPDPTQPTPAPTPGQTTQPTPQPTGPSAACQNLHDSYILAKSEFDRNNPPTSGRTEYLRGLFENEWNQQFAAARC